MADEGLDRNALRAFVRVYYPHVTRTRLFQALSLASCPTQDAQAALASILHDEYGSRVREDRHLAVYERLFSGLGVPTPDLERSLADEDLGIGLYAAAMHGLVRHGHWARAYGAVGIGGELPIPRLYNAIYDAFVRVFGDDLDQDALAVFRTHIDCDDDHAQLLIDAVEPLAKADPVVAQELERGLLLNLEARRLMLNSIMRRVMAES